MRTTDAALLLIRSESLPGEVIATDVAICPSGGPAAMLSFAEALRRGAQAELDIDPDELTVGGLQSRRHVDGTRTSAVYVADTLENGAGYALELAGPRMDDVVRQIADGETGQGWNAPGHSECDSSCPPDCLRSWDNRHLHPALDWRLALDVADLAMGRDLRLARWFDLVPGAVSAFDAASGACSSSRTRSRSWTTSTCSSTGTARSSSDTRSGVGMSSMRRNCNVRLPMG